MISFTQNTTSHLIYVAIVIGTVFTLYLLTNVLHRWLPKKIAQNFPEAPVKPIYIIKHILNILWIALGIIALLFLVMDGDKSADLIYYFKLTGYLGAVALITILAATACNMWFKYKIQFKITNQHDPTSYKFLRYFVVSIIVFIGVLFGLLAFPSLKGVAQTALGGAGVIALIAGVASQEALSNIVGGIFIISFKPFRIGDVIKISETMVGTVTDITLRHTLIRNNENKMIVIPNAIINKEKLINYNLGELKCCEHIEVGISYDSDIDMAKNILAEICAAHPLILDNRSVIDLKDGKPLVKTALTKINDSSYTIRAWAWASNYSDAFALKCDVYERLIKSYKEVGIELAYPTQTIYVMKDSENDRLDAIKKPTDI